MFYLKIDKLLLDKVFRIARKLNTGLEETLKRALNRGLQLLNGESAPGTIGAQMWEKVPVGDGRKEKRIKKLAFIKEHWQNMSDQEMAQALDCNTDYICILRNSLGYKRERGGMKIFAEENKIQFLKENFQKFTDSDLAKELGLSINQIRRLRRGLGLIKKIGGRNPWTQKEIDFLRQNFKSMSDVQLARKLHRTRSSVLHKRFMLGFKRERPKLEIDPLWLRKALLEDGLTCQDVARQYKVSREYISKLADELRINIKKKRKLQWYANRAKKPQLADREFLTSALRDMSLNALANNLQVSWSLISKQLERLGLDLEKLRRERTYIELTCYFCGKKFWRLKSTVRKNQKHVFCNRICNGKYIARQYSPFVKSARTKNKRN